MITEENQHLYGYWKPYKVQYFHATTNKTYSAMVHKFRTVLDEERNVIQIPVIEVEIDGILYSNLEVWYPCMIIKEDSHGQENNHSR